MRQRFLRVLLAGGAALFLERGSLAAAPEPLEAQIYETATVWARPLTRATASVTVLDREAIESLGVSSVAELMRFIPGVDVTPSGPRGGFATAQIRGGDPNFTLVMIDGVPLNDLTDQVGGAVNLNSLPLDAVERIEVVRGPLSSFYGSTGLAGAINVVTRTGSNVSGWSYGAAAGSDSAAQGHVSFGQGDERRDHFVTAWWEQEEDRVVQDDFEQRGIQGNARIPAGSGELQLSGRVTAWEAEDYPEASGGPELGTGETRLSDHEEYSLGAEWWMGSAQLRQKLYLTAYRHELDRESPMIPPGPSGFVPASVEQTTFTSGRLGWAVPRLEAGWAQLGFGVELDFEDGESTAALALPPPFDEGSFALDRYVGGAFVEMLAERGRLLFELGGRVDVPEGFDTEVSPRGGMRYRTKDEKTSLHASLGRAYKLPSFFALGHPIVGNPDLEPEIAVSADLGVDHAFPEAEVDASLTLFYNRFEDLVDFDFGTLSNVNESIRARGVEAAAAWTPLESIHIAANVTYEDVEREGSDEPLRHRPEWIGGLRFGWRATERARLELDGQWVAQRNDEQVPTGPGVVAGYQLYGTAVSYTLGSAWELRARADNLADKDYQTFIGFPGAGRSFLVGLRRVH